MRYRTAVVIPSSQHEVILVRERYPWVETYAAWNEANHVKQPTAHNPRRAAQYYNILREECAGCTLIAADVLDSKNIFSWLATFKRYAKHPRIWGLHSYQDANHFRPLRATVTRNLLARVKGELWLTETGGIVRFGDKYRGGRTFEKRAARAMKYTFRIASSSPRIKRVYLYHWDTDRKFVTWDSAFVDERTGRARPSLNVLRDELNRQRRKSKKPLVPKIGKFPGKKLPLVPDPVVASS